MKKIIFYTLFVSSLLVYSCTLSEMNDNNDSLIENNDFSAFVSSGAQMFRENVLNNIASRYSKKDIEIYCSTNSTDSIYVFVNPSPLANWGHECHYYTISKQSGLMSRRTLTFPPDLSEMETVRRYIPSETDALPDFPKDTSSKTIGTRTNAKWAVIISGGRNKYANDSRFWNDCSFLYRAIAEWGDYPKSHIFTIIADGTDPADDRKISDGTYDSSPLDLDYDGVADIQYAATNANINTVFNYLGNNVSSGDEVLIFVVNHGSRISGQSYLDLWGGESISSYSFSTQVDKITSSAYINIVMGQCHSGGFIGDLVGSNRTITTSCSEEEYSYARSSFFYDEFVYHWITAIFNRDPNGFAVYPDSDSNGYTSVYEAYDYARLHDIYFPGGLSSNPSIAKNQEHPHISPDYPTFPISYSKARLSGDLNISENGTHVYSLIGLPSTATTQWSTHSLISAQGSTNSTLTVNKVFWAGMVFYAWVSAEVTFANKIYTTDFINITLWKNGMVIGNHYIEGNPGLYGGSFSICRNFDGITDYYWITSNNWTAYSQGYYTTLFGSDESDSGEVDISVSFTNPFGQSTTICDHFTLPFE